MGIVRLGVVLVTAALLLPAASSAQRLPLPGTGRRGPARPAPLPPQPDPIARPLAYKRLRLSVETYPLITYIRSPAFSGEGLGSDWTAFGTGTRADYRVGRKVAVTLDLTSSFAGGPADVHTAELGTRLRPERSERRLYPFVDVRVGYVRSSSGYFGNIGGFDEPTIDGGGAFRYSSGYGAAGGAGFEYTLTRTLSLTTAGSIMRNRMTAHMLVGGPPSDRSYTMTLYRYTVGIRYNPVRAIRVPGTDPY
jgi:hypothetical protein